MMPSFVLLQIAVIATFVTILISVEAEEEFDFREDAKERLRSHYALNYGMAKKLAMTEEKVVTRLVAFSLVVARKGEGDEAWDPECTERLHRYLMEFEKDSAVVMGQTGYLRAKMVAENPLLLYRMILRMSILKNETLVICSEKGGNNAEIVRIVEENVASSGIDLPADEDLDDALLGIIRIHYTYGFSAQKELRLGIFGRVQTNAVLNFQQCTLLAKRAMQMNAVGLAYQWIDSARLIVESENDPSRPEKKIENEEMLRALWTKLLEMTKLKNMEGLHSLMGTSIPAFTPFETFLSYATCRGESSLSNEEKSKLTCFRSWKENPYWLIQPLKVEVLHLDPPLWQFHDFVGEQTSTYIRHEAQKTLARSGTVSVDTKRTIYSNYRTSMTTWIYDSEVHNPSKEMMQLNRRIEMSTGLNVIKEHSSQAMQIVSYSSLGGHYDYHDDALETPVLTKQAGDRVATFLLFLSDVTLGGYTAFPNLNIYATPVKGSAIFWHNLYRNGQKDSRFMHGGCPVILGSKTAANKWIMEYGNVFNYQCTLEENE